MRLILLFITQIFVVLICHAQQNNNNKEARLEKQDFEYIMPLNQPVDNDLLRLHPRVFLVKTVKVDKLFIIGILNDKEVRIYPYIVSNKVMFAKVDITEEYQEIKEDRYYLMALEFPASSYNDLPIGYANIYHHTSDGRIISLSEYYAQTPRVYIAINMIDNMIRPVVPSDCKKLDKRLNL